MVWSEGKAENKTLIDSIYQKYIDITYCSHYFAQSSSYVRSVDSHVRWTEVEISRKKNTGLP